MLSECESCIFERVTLYTNVTHSMLLHTFLDDAKNLETSSPAFQHKASAVLKLDFSIWTGTLVHKTIPFNILLASKTIIQKIDKLSTKLLLIKMKTFWPDFEANCNLYQKF